MKIKIKLNEKVKLILKILFVSTVFLFIVKEFNSVFKSFNMDYFLEYKNRLDILNLLIIAVLGIISYIPLSFYDFLLKKKVGINLSNRKLYKYSWIASSISSLLGFGGATSLAFKQYFYNDHVKDKKKLLKEIGKIVALNLTGLSLICIIYILLEFTDLISLGILKYPIIVISAYAPILIGILIYKYIKTKESEELFYTLGTIGISFSEWLTTILLIYVTLRIIGADLSVSQFITVYVKAAVVGIISMVPGGIGTFDLTFITGLEPLGIPVEQSLVVIILYRISYYIVPASIGVILYIHDFGRKLNDNFNGIPRQILSKIAYNCLVVLVFLSGVVMILSNIAPQVLYKIRFLKMFLGKQLVGISLALSIIIGFLLILTSLMLKYRSRGVYKVTIYLLILGTIFSLSRGIKLNEIIFFIVVAYIVYLSRHMFYRKSFVVTWKNTIIDMIILLISFIVYFISIVKIGTFMEYKISKYFPYKFAYLYGIYAFIIITVIYVAIYFLNRRRRIPVKTFDECEEDIKNILENYNGTSLTHLIFLKDKYIYLNKDKDVLFQYEVFVDKLFVLGNPIGNKEKIFNEIENFSDFADSYGYTPVFYHVDDTMINYLHSNGYDFMKVGEEAKVEVQDFKVVGNKMKSLKTSRNKVIKEGYTFEIIKPPFSKELMQTLRNISDEWLDNRKEKGFSVGFFDEDYLSRAPISVVKSSEGEIKAFSNIMYMYDNNKSFSVDLMRFTKNAPRGIMDFMFISLIESGKEEGYETFNMGVAPLANVGVSKYAFWNEKLALQFYEYGQVLYSFKGLRRFKEKFTDKWDNKYIAYRRNTSVLIIVIQAAILCAKSKRKDDVTILERFKEVVY